MFQQLPFKRCYILLLILMMAASGFKRQPSQLYTVTNGKISFRSDAPLEVIRASSSEMIGLIDIDKKNFSLKVQVHSFQGFNSPLQKEHFNENYMESDKYPEASFKGKIIEDGSHHELMTKKGYYFNLYTRQLREQREQEMLNV